MYVDATVVLVRYLLIIYKLIVIVFCWFFYKKKIIYMFRIKYITIIRLIRKTNRT